MIPKIEYKPDYRIECVYVPRNLWDDPNAHVGQERIRVTVSWTGLDSGMPGHYRGFSSSHEYNVEDDEDVRVGILDAIEYCEIHEAREWLRLDGEVYRDPHAPGGDPRESPHAPGGM